MATDGNMVGTVTLGRSKMMSVIVRRLTVRTLTTEYTQWAVSAGDYQIMHKEDDSI